VSSQARTAAVSSPDDGPRWRTVAIAMSVAGVAMLPLSTQGVALYLYAFPLFGVGVPYVLQFRSAITRAWWVTFIAITPLSVVALALEWPFSGHVLWNILFLAHAEAVVRSRVWMWVFVGSLVHLVTLKAIFQTSHDLVGAFLSAAVAGGILLVLWRRGELDHRPTAAATRVGGSAGVPPS
jgi:hypothetical protein